MEENNKLILREELKTYFETGKYPTQNQFGRFIDNYIHLNEFNFGLEIKPTGNHNKKHYHFYVADDLTSGSGHMNIESEEGTAAQKIKNFTHVLSRNIGYKYLNVKLLNDLDLQKYNPKIIIKRYKQRKKLRSGYIKKAGFYQELPADAKLWGRESEYPVTQKEMVLDINPINYFRPHSDYKQFSPSGTFNRPGSFKYSTFHRKSFSLIQMILEIDVNGTKLRSNPVNIKIILGSKDENDLINYIIN